MAYGSMPLEKRLKENIKNYSLGNLFTLEKIQAQFRDLHNLLGVELLLTERHGEKALAVGNFAGFVPDVVGEPGRKIRIASRTVGHLYVTMPAVDADSAAMIEDFLDGMVDTYAALGQQCYYHKETAIYADELESRVELERRRVKQGEDEDALTGTLNKTYFAQHLHRMQQNGIAPVAAVCANINDWKFANDHFGDDESNRLIRIVADIIKQESKPAYVIGRVDGDVFHIAIPMPEDGEAEAFCGRIQEACTAYEDAVLAPSIAVGLAYKENVEEAFEDVYSDAEYEMFQNKFDVKNAAGYRQRLEHGVK